MRNNHYISLHIIILFLTVTDMCKSSFATENVQYSGNFSVDSVVLRIIIQQDDCICRVTIDNQIEPISIGLSKYDGSISSAPVIAQCGLAVDINHIPIMSIGPAIDPIECMNNVNFRHIQLLKNSSLQFKSRIINGSFTRGYCMRIHRGIVALEPINNTLTVTNRTV